MDSIRMGIVGVGVQGGTYARMLTGGEEAAKDILRHVRLGGLCDTDPKVKAACREKYPGIPFYDSYQELIASGEVDAVITTVPHYFHTEIARYALEHNTHVLVEKPAGILAEDVRRMNQCAADHPDLTFGIMFNQRTNELYRRIRDLVASGELGEMRRTNWIINSWWRSDAYYRLSAWRATWGGEGGGVLVNQAPHQLDLWQWICGIPTRVFATMRFGAHRDIAVDNDVTILTRYANGATGCFITCTHDPVGTDRLEIDLGKGKIVVTDSARATLCRFSQSEDEINRNNKDTFALISGNASKEELFREEEITFQSNWGSQHAEVMENFALHILKGEPLLAPGSDGINGVNLANAAYLSAWLGQEVDLPVDGELFRRELNRRIEEEGKYPVRG